MDSKKITVGIVGCGLIADTHVEAALAARPDSRIVLVDPMPGKGDLLSAKYGLGPSYASISEMLDKEKPVAVHVLSPAHLHYEHTMELLEGGCHVLVEKPLTFKIEEAWTLFTTAQKVGRHLCVNHTLLCQPSVQQMMRSLDIDGGERVLHANLFYGMFRESLGQKSMPLGHWKRGIPGGPMVDTLIHPITLAVELTGQPEKPVLQVTNENGEISELHLSWAGKTGLNAITISLNAEPFRRFTEIITNRQTFTIDNTTETLVRLGPGVGPGGAKKLFRNIDQSVQLSWGTLRSAFRVATGQLKENPGTREIVKSFYKTIEEEKTFPVSMDNVLWSTQVLEQATGLMDEVRDISPPSQTEGKEIVQPLPGKLTGKVLVTGASGFLGTEICKYLVSQKVKVVAQVRRGQNADKLPAGVEIVYFDFANGLGYREGLLKGVKHVIHCAHAAGARTWEQYKKVNADASLEFYEEAAEKGVENFVYISSVAVYGVHQKGKRVMTEESPMTNGGTRWDFYIRSKKLGEELLTERAATGGPKLAIVRPGVLYSVDGMRLMKKAIPVHEKKYLIAFGSGKNQMPFTRVDHVALTVAGMLAMTPFPEEIFNLVGHPGMPSREFTRDRLEKLGHRISYITVPVLPLRMVAIVLETLHTLTFRKVPPKISRYNLDSATRNIEYDCTRAEKELGWDPVAAVSELP